MFVDFVGCLACLLGPSLGLICLRSVVRDIIRTQYASRSVGGSRLNGTYPFLLEPDVLLSILPQVQTIRLLKRW